MMNMKCVLMNSVINNSSNKHEEFKIICISSCKGLGFLSDVEIEKGEIFNTNYYEFNYGETYARLFRNGRILGLFEQKNFLKLEDYRHKTINDLVI